MKTAKIQKGGASAQPGKGNKKDLMLAVILIAAAAVMFLVIRIAQKDTGNRVVIRVDGKKYGEYSINRDQTINIDTDRGHNEVVISEGAVHMEEADCPDKYCIRQGSIDHEGETIVCLPHRVVVEVEKNGAGEKTDQKNDSVRSDSATDSESFDTVAQ